MRAANRSRTGNLGCADQKLKALYGQSHGAVSFTEPALRTLIFFFMAFPSLHRY